MILFDREILKAAEVQTASDVVLRPYQRDAVDAVFREWQLHKRTMVVAATGLGKSVIFTEVMDRVARNRNGHKILVLAHREELIYQAVGHAKRAGLSAGIEMATSRAVATDAVVVSTIQTQVSKCKCRECGGAGCEACRDTGKEHRFQRFDPFRFSAVIVDEAHHATARTYRKVMDWYGRNPVCRMLLVTATPKRADDIGLHNVCDSVAYQMDIPEAIGQGWLVPVRQRVIEIDAIHLESVGTKAGGDFADGQLEAAMLGNGDDAARAKILHGIMRPTIEQAAGRPVLVFAPGVVMAAELSAVAGAYGVRSELVIGDTDNASRAKYIDQFRSGEVQMLCGCGVFTEGFDAPATAVIAMARPTRSLSLYQQCIGRGTRPLPGVVDGLGKDTPESRHAAIAASRKPYCTVLDFAGNAGRHKIISVVDVLAGEDIRDDDRAEAIRKAAESDEPQDMLDLLKRAMDAREAAEEEEQRRKEEAEQRRRERYGKQKANVSYSATDVDLFGNRLYRAKDEDFGPWVGGATPAQIALLKRLGVSGSTAARYNKRQASAVIGKLMNKGEGR